MSDPQLITVPLATDASGDYSSATQDICGAVLQIRYVVDGTSPLDTGADLTITGTKTGLSVASMTNIGTSSFTKALRQATHATDGTASLYAGAGEPVEAPIHVIGESLTVTIAQGGASKVGTLYIWVGQP